MAIAALIATLALQTQGAPEIVRHADGTLSEGYEAGRACNAERRCGPFIREIETGAIVMFNGEWAAGFRETRRGQQVRKLPAAPTARRRTD